MARARGLLEQAEKFSRSGRVAKLAVALWRDPELGARFDESPEKVLEEFDVKVPEGLRVVPLGFGELGKPGPDWVPFQIRLTNCRTVYVRDDEPPHKLREETVCFGFEIIPNRIPGGPLG
jgi:hypothetical protein